MKKTELVSKIAEQTGFSKVDSEKALDAVVETVSGSLSSGESVNLAGLGVFSVVERAARNGRNPQTGESIKIPASKAVKFKVSKSLKEAVK